MSRYHLNKQSFVLFVNRKTAILLYSFWMKAATYRIHVHQSRNVMKYIYFVTYLPCDRPAKMQLCIHVLLQ